MWTFLLSSTYIILFKTPSQFKGSAILTVIFYCVNFSIVIHLHNIFKDTQPISKDLQFWPLSFIVWTLLLSSTYIIFLNTPSQYQRIVIHLHNILKDTQPISKDLQFWPLSFTVWTLLLSSTNKIFLKTPSQVQRICNSDLYLLLCELFYYHPPT